MIKYKIRGSDWLTFPLIIVNFNHFFIQPAPDCEYGGYVGTSNDSDSTDRGCGGYGGTSWRYK